MNTRVSDWTSGRSLVAALLRIGMFTGAAIWIFDTWPIGLPLKQANTGPDRS